MLASVRSVEEAQLMAGAGADVIDLKEPADGVLGALPLATVREITSQLEGRVQISATIGDFNDDLQRIGDAATAMAKVGVDIVKVGLFDRLFLDRLLQGLAALVRGGIHIVLVTFAEQDGHRINVGKVAAAGLSGVMVDTAEKRTGSLLQKVPVEDLRGFVREAQGAGLVSGLAGALRAEDVAELLSLNVDYLGFRSALCKGNEREQRICIRRARIIRALIPESTAAAGLR
ncbi:MAG: hypothetical protein HYY48_00520 [Gammaproteobacteria bacterium]|nr:hypothetical protein [Gammaproteobacteria bacterium]